MKKIEKIDIILPHKLGDSIMSLPMLLALKQLVKKHKNYDVRIVSLNPLTTVLKKLNLFPVIQMDLNAKIKSQFFPSDKAFYLSSTSKSFLYKGKKTYGIINAHKKYLKYNFDMPSFSTWKTSAIIPKDLYCYLKREYFFCTLTIGFFAVLMELGFSIEEIKSTFEYDINSLNIDSFSDVLTPEISSDYLVFCLEAGGNKSRNSYRRWNSEYFIQIAEDLCSKSNLKAVFIGQNKSPLLPNNDSFIDLRQSLNITQLAKVLWKSKGYIGNDTGPLHLTNLMKKQSVGIYKEERILIDFSPIFFDINHPLIKSRNIEPALLKAKELFINKDYAKN